MTPSPTRHQNALADFAALLLPAEPYAQSGAVENVILEGARHGIAQVPVAERDVPREPLCDTHQGTQVKVDAEVWRIRKAIEHAIALNERDGAVQLVIQLVAPVELRRVSSEGRGEFCVLIV